MTFLSSLWRTLKTACRNRTLNVVAAETVHLETGFQASVFAPTPDGGQKIGARRTDWFETKTSTEMDTAKRFSLFTDNGLTDFQKANEDDDVDIQGRSPDGSVCEDFQVTRLWDGEFWKPLNTTGASDRELTREEIRELILRAVERKGTKKYAHGRRRMLTLLIDTNPVPVLAQLVSGIQADLKVRLDEIGFKQVWLVGSETGQTFEISSSRKMPPDDS